MGKQLVNFITCGCESSAPQGYLNVGESDVKMYLCSTYGARENLRYERKIYYQLEVKMSYYLYDKTPH